MSIYSYLCLKHCVSTLHVNVDFLWWEGFEGRTQKPIHNKEGVIVYIFSQNPHMQPSFSTVALNTLLLFFI